MTTSRHAIEPEELMAYLDGELPADRAATAVAHLEHCLECQSLAVELRGAFRQMMTWEVEAVDSSIPPRILAALQQREQKPESPAITPTLPFRNKVMMRRWMWAGAFAILCIVVGVGTQLAPNRQAMHLMTSTRARPASESVALPSPEIAADSNGLFHGLGDHAQNSVSVDGQPMTDQRGKVFDKIGTQLQNSLGVGPMIIRTAGITITTSDFGNARAALEDILKRHHGYVGELNVSTPTGSARSISATLRVPADQLGATMADLRKLGRVESESQSGQEVTAQYVDLEARLTNAKHTEERLTDLLSQRTGKLSDVLAFEKEIDRVRGEIESMEAERKNLSNQVDFATISATVAEDYKAQLQLAPVSTSSQIHNAAVEGYRTVVEGVVGVILFLFSYGPIMLVCAGILFFPARAAWRRYGTR